MNHVAIQILDGISTSFLIFHMDKAIILDDVALDDFAVFLEEGLNVGIGGLVGEVADKNLERTNAAEAWHVFSYASFLLLKA